ncbi:MAG: hypothetical protein WCE51_06080 [Chthoniobacterales bacterium]
MSASDTAIGVDGVWHAAKQRSGKSRASVLALEGGRGIARSNENKMSDSGPARASLEVEGWKSYQK